jgi:hypothetical protein
MAWIVRLAASATTRVISTRHDNIFHLALSVSVSRELSRSACGFRQRKKKWRNLLLCLLDLCRDINWMLMMVMVANSSRRASSSSLVLMVMCPCRASTRLVSSSSRNSMGIYIRTDRNDVVPLPQFRYGSGITT